MKRHVLLYGLIAGLLIAALKWTECHFLVGSSRRLLRTASNLFNMGVIFAGDDWCPV